jgi:choline-glycine betaine transporter
VQADARSRPTAKATTCVATNKNKNNEQQMKQGARSKQELGAWQEQEASKKQGSKAYGLYGMASIQWPIYYLYAYACAYVHVPYLYPIPTTIDHRP